MELRFTKANGLLSMVKQLNEPIEVTITEWNTRSLLQRIKGLMAFLPKAELMNRVNNFTELKENCGLLHISNITRGKITYVSDLLKVGEQVKVLVVKAVVLGNISLRGGRRIHVQITRINDETNDVILSEKEGWEMMNLQHGTLLDGTIKKVFPYGYSFA
ncbi:hypothetical protein OROGR_033018 [Orobanche gracilis]